MVGAAEQHFDVAASVDKQWCPGCGNFPILQTVKKSLRALGKDPTETVFVSGIGQAAKTPQYINTHYFNGLHGRALPAATGIKAANPTLEVIVESGDGDVYGEGGNHLIHTIRRNPDMTVIVHDNMIYGLTKGQASPTTNLGQQTPTQPQGVYDAPLNPMALAISLDAAFVARSNAGDPVQLQAIIERAIAHKGFALVDVFQPCVVFNKTNTYQWFQEHSYTIDESHDVTDQQAAFARAIETEKFALGVLYAHQKHPVFHEAVGTYTHDATPLFARTPQYDIVQTLIKSHI